MMLSCGMGCCDGVGTRVMLTCSGCCFVGDICRCLWLYRRTRLGT